MHKMSRTLPNVSKRSFSAVPKIYGEKFEGRYPAFKEFTFKTLIILHSRHCRNFVVPLFLATFTFSLSFSLSYFAFSYK